ncbi:tRNA delta(2)-isopentenylpyrophosphate transferase [Streptococcus sp. DD13]|nr:tRNA delta(2)-isopentenylpyrophosphate transferase [Streptococcus sp. DD13]
MDIGTAKASPEEQAQVRHHLIDVRDVSDSYSAFDFVREATSAISEIREAGKVPIIVGGTGLYLQSLLEGYHLGGQVDHEEVLSYREELEKMEDEVLFSRVAELGLQISQLNRRRAIRSLELDRFGNGAVNQQPAYDPLLIALTDERSTLYERINQRVDQMLDRGLLEEVNWLYQNYPDAQAARGIGYKEFFPYLRGEEELDVAVARVKQQTRRFAKRQLTWFRNRMHADFYCLSQEGEREKIHQKVKEFLDD